MRLCDCVHALPSAHGLLSARAGPGDDDDDETPIGDPDDDEGGDDDDDEDDEEDTLWAGRAAARGSERLPDRGRVESPL